MAYADPRVHVNVAFRPELHRQAVAMAKAEGLSLSRWLQQLVEQAAKRAAGRTNDK